MTPSSLDATARSHLGAAGDGPSAQRHEPLTPLERATCAVCADGLSTHIVWARLAACGAAAWLASLWLTGEAHRTRQLVLLAALPVLIVIERHLTSRLSLDALLFARLARGDLPGLHDLDVGLQQGLGVPASKGGRPLGARIAGAHRLYRLHRLSALAFLPPALAAWWPG